MNIDGVVKVLPRRTDDVPKARSIDRRVKIVPLVAALLLFPILVVATEDLPLPTPRGYVTDTVGVIEPGVARSLEALIGELKAKTGAEIAVVVVPSTQPLSAFDYAMKIAEQWRPGAKRIDNGVVFVVAVQDRQMFILTGYGVEGALPDGRVGEIRDRIVRPAFRRGDFGSGIRDAVREMAARIAQDAGVELTGAPPSQRPQAIELSPRQMLLLLFAGLLLVFLLGRTGVLPLLLAGGPGYGRGRTVHGGFGGRGFGGGFGGGGGGFGGFGGGGFGGGGAGGGW